MKRRYNLTEALELLWNPDEELRDQEESEEEEEEEDVSEEEDNCEENENNASTDEEESSDEEEEPQMEECFQSKDGSLLWSSIPPSDRRRMLVAERERSPRGPTRYAVARVDSITSAFQLFLPDQVEKIVLNMTNKEGRRVYGNKWREMDGIALQAYLGLLILAGVYRSNKESTASLWHAQSGRAIFGATMPLKMFHIISRVIRFDDRDTRTARRARDKLAAIRDVWDKWVCLLQQMYNPGADVTVDERLVPFRGRCAFKQYMPNKPGKYGIKIWTACDARTSYAFNMQVYTGKPADGQPEKNQGKRVVLEMAEGLRGQTITCDNFFTSHALGQELLKRKLSMVGTVRKNKPELPPALLATKDRARYSSKFAFSETHTIVSYCPKKGRNVLLMSTLHRDTAVSAREDKKPQVILDYNHNKGGVDNLDKVTSVYTCKRKTARWPLVVFYNILDVSAYNSFVLWTEINPTYNQGKCHRRRLFLEELGRELVMPLIKRRQVLPRAPASASLVVEIQTDGPSTSAAAPTNPAAATRKRCRFCPGKSDLKTSIRCQNCMANICKKHAITTTHCPSCK
ncbi:piggyBac transposable element-derived protein 4-like [Micropterus salmoides]|uniref:piggyBac transposable element-derived protein 4-like n=1 Tax=Micropterus salmoides TaxID=27706 RepID=UPI0018ED61B8|nr:piggyBac transposable element-derived protein 4-like [Micropterus salmoides]